MRYDGDIAISSLDIANEAAILFSLVKANYNDLYEELVKESVSTEFDDYSMGLHTGIFEIPLNFIINKTIYLAVVTRNLHYHLRNSDLLDSIDNSIRDKIDELIEFCNKVVHGTSIQYDRFDFTIEISKAQKPYTYNVARFCERVVWFAEWVNSMDFNGYMNGSGANKLLT